MIRFSVAPRKWLFVKEFLNIIDLLAVLPFIFEIILYCVSLFHFLLNLSTLRLIPSCNNPFKLSGNKLALIQQKKVTHSIHEDLMNIQGTGKGTIIIITNNCSIFGTIKIEI